MDDRRFNIYLEQLRNGKKTIIEESCPSDFMEVKEEDLFFNDTVTVEGEAYLAGDALVISCQLITIATMPCAICNEPVKVEIEVTQFYHAEELSNIKGGIYNYKNAIREAILLEVPPFAECEPGNCPHRKEIERFLRPPGDADASQKEEGYRPFADL
jgi:uncharacterized metal-binding protein YceD (DUF177 family)